MKIEQFQYNRKKGWDIPLEKSMKDAADWVIIFGEKNLIKSVSHMAHIKACFPNAVILSGSTAGEIHDNQVHDNTLSLTAVKFNKSHINAFQDDLTSYETSFEMGKALAEKIDQKNLKHIFILSDGVKTNATELINGIYSVIPETIVITGGLCGDGASFKETVLGLDGNNKINQSVIVGFYGDQLKVGYGSRGGWIPFGPKRVVTKSNGNILYELDHQLALDLYKIYLKDQAKELPASGLLFPLSLVDKTGENIINDSGIPIVRTVVGVNEDDKSLMFAGDIPEGSITQLMQASTEDLIEGAVKAAQISIINNESPELVVMISCVGRKLIMGQQSVEEVEEVINQYKKANSKTTSKTTPSVTGFYSYGEICPFFINQTKCQKSLLHNQTMTITTFSEK